jgi:hypothetical protein
LLPLLVPVLAQAITLSAGAAVEGRAVFEDGTEYQGTATGNVGLSFEWRRLTLTFGYAPTLEVVPLDHEPRSVSIFHTGVASGQYVKGHTTVGLTHAFGVGRLNLRTRALSEGASAQPDGETPSGAGDAPGPTELRADDSVVRYGTSATDVFVLHQLTRVLRLRGEIGYGVSGALDRESSVSYPLVETNRALAGATYELSPRDSLTGTLTGQYAASSTGRTAQIANAEASYQHEFSRATTADASARLSATREPDPAGRYTAYSVYPGFTGNITTSSVLGRGRTTFNANVAAVPVLDLTTAQIDPRLSFGAGAGYSLHRSTFALTVLAAHSMAAEGAAGSIRSVAGSAGFGYRLLEFMHFTSGVRCAYQAYEDDEVVPFTYLVFVGLSFHTAIPLVR